MATTHSSTAVLADDGTVCGEEGVDANWGCEWSVCWKESSSSFIASCSVNSTLPFGSCSKCRMACDRAWSIAWHVLSCAWSHAFTACESFRMADAATHVGRATCSKAWRTCADGCGRGASFGAVGMASKGSCSVAVDVKG